jgi:hypothetical protein
MNAGKRTYRRLPWITTAIVVCLHVGTLSAADFSLYPFTASSESGYWQFGVNGRLILDGFAPGPDGAGLITGGANFFSGEASLFTDLHIGSHLYATGEFRLDTGEVPQKGVVTGRVEQAYLRYKPWLNRSLHLQYGKFVSPFGAYNQRHDTAADPFIRPPLMYDYRTMVSSRLIPRTNDGFIDWKYFPNIFRPEGAPVIWQNPYQVGAMFFGGLQKFDFRFAAMNSAPSSEPDMWNYQIGQKIHPSYVVHAGYRVIPELYVGMAYNTGPYLDLSAKPDVEEGEFNQYKQRIWEVEFLFERGKTQIRGEAFHDTWEVENVLDYPVDLSGYVEVQQAFLSGFYGAFRYGAIRYNKISLSSGQKEVWDFRIWRSQVAAGYHILRNLDVRVEYMWNRTSGLPDPQDDLFSVQCRIEF